MKRIIFSLLVVGLFAGIGTSATAKDTPAGNLPAEYAHQPAVSAKQHNPANGDVNIPPTSKAEYNGAKDRAFTQYMNAKAKCDSLEGEAMRTRVTDARRAQTEALAQAKTQWESQGATKGTGGDAMSRSGKYNNAKGGAKPAKDR